MLENGWLEGNLDLANEIISREGRSQGPGDTLATDWKDWALDLPADARWDSLRRTAIRRRALAEPGEWNTFADLPSRDLREAAYAAALHTLDLERDRDRVPWILHQITDPALRSVALKVITERLDNSTDEPFAATDIDPFDPLGK
jgi:hypothetical protein